jgi:drug/metabolite transporter (DMT)-like permease
LALSSSSKNLIVVDACEVCRERRIERIERIEGINLPALLVLFTCTPLPRIFRFEEQAMKKSCAILAASVLLTCEQKSCMQVAAFTGSDPRHKPTRVVLAPLISSVKASRVTRVLASVSQEDTIGSDASNNEPLQTVGTLVLEQAVAPTKVAPLDALAALVYGNSDQANREYQRGLVTIGFITLLFSSNSPVLHSAFTSGSGATPPVLLLNAGVSCVALLGLLVGGETLEQNTELPSALIEQQQQQRQQQRQQQLQLGQAPQDLGLQQQNVATNNPLVNLLSGGEDKLKALQGGCELGLWKFLGTTANIYGLSLTTAAHGSFLIQLTTLIVPVVQGVMGVPIPKRIQFSIVLALAGVVCFTQDPTGTPSLMGDALCVVAAAFYATYDLRLFSWGKQVPARRLITGKIATQALLSVGLLLTAGSTSALLGSDNVSDLSAWQETMQYVTTNPQWTMLIPVILWSGVVVNALAPFLQVGGQQAVGPTRCQTIYASQPLWAAIMSFVVFGETIGFQGLFGGTAFLTALFLAATTEAPDPDCGKAQCEV